MDDVLDLLAAGASRSEVLSALMNVLVHIGNADASGYFTIGVDGEGVPRFIDIHAAGPATIVQALKSIEGVAYTSLLTPTESFRRAPKFGCFTAMSRANFDSELARRTWDPAGIHTALGLNAQSTRGKFLGQVTLFRAGSSHEFSSRERDLLQRFASKIEAVLAAVFPSFGTEHRDAILLFRPDGELWMQRGHPAACDETEFRRSLEAMVARIRSGETTMIDAFVEEALVRACLLEGQDAAVLVTIHQVQPMVVDRLYLLSPTCRQIIAAACQGATAVEIAKTLNRSPETIRTHMKLAYEQLGIGTRAEIVALVERSISSPSPE